MLSLPNSSGCLSSSTATVLTHFRLCRRHFGQNCFWFAITSFSFCLPRNSPCAIVAPSHSLGRDTCRLILCMAPSTPCGAVTTFRGRSSVGALARPHLCLSILTFLFFPRRLSPESFRAQGVYFFFDQQHPPAHPAGVFGLGALGVNGLKPHRLRRAGEGVDTASKAIQRPPYLKRQSVLWRHFLRRTRPGTFAAAALWLVAIGFRQFAAFFACEPVAVPCPTGPRAQFFLSSSSPMRATLRMRIANAAANSGSHSQISRSISGVNASSLPATS